MSAAAPLDLLWVLVCAALVALMQIGFLLLEAGAVRAKNAVSVALKNVADFCLATLAFWMVGYGLMFGASAGGVFGAARPGLGSTGPEAVVFFLFQAAFCGAAATIMSGAVAERMRFGGYLLATLLIAGLVYPVFGHWAWGGLAAGAPAGWLERLGFVDFAGSTVVHSVGGWVALAAAVVVGPRAGAFERGRGPGPRDLSLTAAGALFLWIGWLGFNGGSTLAFDAAVPGVLLNTMLAAAAGGAAGLGLCAAISGRPEAAGLINGTLGGLVAVTASAHLAAPAEAAALGAAGAGAAVFGARLLLRARIDDPVGAIPVHLVAGVVGTLAVAVVAPHPDAWTRLAALGAQAAGVAAAGAWAFGVAWPVFRLIDRVRPLRVSAEAEAAGLSLAEHGAGSALAEVIAAMEAQRLGGDFTSRAPVRAGEEAGLIAAQYNRVLARVEEEIAARERLAAGLAEARREAEDANRAKSQFLATMSHELRTPMNGVMGLAALLERSDLDDRQAALVREIRASGETLVGLLGDLLEIAGEGGASALRTPFSARALAAGVRAEHMRAAVDKGLAFEVDCDDPPELRRLGDARRIAHIARHLVDNALRFTERGGVRVRLASRGDRLDLLVRDDGPGLPQQARARLFEPFAQGDASETRAVGGAGVGLAVVATLARALGGTVAAENPAEGGALFRVSVPAPVAVEDAGARAAG